MTTRLLAAGVACAASLCLAANPALAATRCVGSGHGCYRTIQSALDAAHDGDAIKVGPGSFAGPITITKSVGLSGSGAGATVIRGGGPVVTIGSFGAASEPTVSIAGVKITGGRTGSSPDGTFRATGGGVFIPAAADFAPGATVTIRDSVISGNRVAPTTTLGPEADQTDLWPVCPDGPCPYAGAEGAGIDNWGSLKLTGTVVSDNEAGGPVTSDAEGAGIWSDIGSLTLVDSKVVRNRSAVAPPNGRFAEGGGIFVGGGSFTIRNTLVGDNATNLATEFPAFAGDTLIEATSQAGGIFVKHNIPTTIERTVIANNESTASGPSGEPAAYDSGLLVLDSTPTIRDTLIIGNRVESTTLTTADIGPVGAAFELHHGGTVSNVKVIGNRSVARTSDGDAWVTGGLNVFHVSAGDPLPAALSDSVIAGNSAVAVSKAGAGIAQGGGVYNNSLLELRRVAVSDNLAKASAPSGMTEGGGIWNGVAFTGPPVELTLTDSLLTGNVLAGSTAIERRGGGLFTTEPVTRTRTRIAGNAPDQCFGCGAALQARSAARRRRANSQMRMTM
jgi:hypothetical protein